MYGASRGLEIIQVDRKDKIIKMYFNNENEKNEWFEQIYIYTNMLAERTVIAKYKWFLEKCPTYILSQSDVKPTSKENDSNSLYKDHINILKDGIIKAEVAAGSLKGIKNLSYVNGLGTGSYRETKKTQVPVIQDIFKRSTSISGTSTVAASKPAATRTNSGGGFSRASSVPSFAPNEELKTTPKKMPQTISAITLTNMEEKESFTPSPACSSKDKPPVPPRAVSPIVDLSSNSSNSTSNSRSGTPSPTCNFEPIVPPRPPSKIPPPPPPITMDSLRYSSTNNFSLPLPPPPSPVAFDPTIPTLDDLPLPPQEFLISSSQSMSCTNLYESARTTSNSVSPRSQISASSPSFDHPTFVDHKLNTNAARVSATTPGKTQYHHNQYTTIPPPILKRPTSCVAKPSMPPPPDKSTNNMPPPPPLYNPHENVVSPPLSKGAPRSNLLGGGRMPPPPPNSMKTAPQPLKLPIHPPLK
eukprot:gene17529-20918_t